LDKDNLDMFNQLVQFINSTNDNKLKDHASMLLAQYNTASGIRMKSEIEIFLIKNKKVA